VSPSFYLAKVSPKFYSTRFKKNKNAPPGLQEKQKYAFKKNKNTPPPPINATTLSLSANGKWEASAEALRADEVCDASAKSRDLHEQLAVEALVLEPRH